MIFTAWPVFHCNLYFVYLHLYSICYIFFYHISVWREYCVGRWVSLCPGSQLQVIVMGLVRFVWQVRFCGASGGSKGKKKNKVIFKWNLIWSMYKRIANASLLTSSSDLHACDYLRRRGLDTAGEDCSGVIEAWYNSSGNPAALTGFWTAGNKPIIKAPLYMNSLSSDQRAVLSDDTCGCHRGSQRYHWAGCVDLCTGLYAIL